MSVTTSQHLCWHGIHLVIPAQWDIGRHSVNSQKGALYFVDRRMQRLVLNWICVGAPPDTRTLIDNCRSRDATTANGESCSALRSIAGWTGYSWKAGECTMARFGRYEPHAGRWIETVFSSSGEGSQSECDTILCRYHHDRVPTAVAQWAACGLHFFLDREWRLDQLRYCAGETAMRFVQGRQQLIVSRKALASVWLKGSVCGYLYSDARLNGANALRVNGHDAWVASGKEQEFSSWWLVGMRRCRIDCAWVCTNCDTLFRISLIGRKATADSLSRVRVDCCSPDRGEL